MKKKLYKNIQNLIILSQKYTSVLLSSLAMSICAIVLIEQKDLTDQEQFLGFKIMLTCGLGISLLFAWHMMAQREGKRLLWEALGLGILVLFYFVLPSEENKMNTEQVFTIGFSFVLSHLLVSFIPFIRLGDENHFWQYNKNLFISIVQTGIFTGVFTAGVLLAVMAIENLFGIKIEYKIYPEIIAFLGIFGSTVIFLLFQQGSIKEMEADEQYPIILKFFTQFILIPLLLLYGVILYLYVIKIVYTFELPKGWVSYMVLAYSVFGILALLLVHPLRHESARSWVRMFHKIFFGTLIPLIVLLFVAINTRLLEYGFTEARYVVLLIACWLVFIILYTTLVKNHSIKGIPISLFIFLMFALIFPYFNVFSVAVRSQKNNLEKLLNENHLLINGKIDFNHKIADSVAENIINKFEYLSEHFENSYLATFLSDKEKKAFKDQKKWNIDGLFTHIVFEKDHTTKKYFNFRINSTNRYVITSGDTYVFNESNMNNESLTIGTDHIKLQEGSYNEDPSLELILNDKETVQLIPLIQKLFEPYNIKEGETTSDHLYIEHDLGRYHIRICFSSIWKTMENQKVQYRYDNMIFLLKKK